MSEEDECVQLLSSMRSQCLGKGINGIKGLSALFRGMDRNFTKTVNLEEFREGLIRYGINIQEDKVHILFDHFDKDGNGVIDFHEFLLRLRGPLPQCRLDVINEAFDKLDVIRDDVLEVQDLKVAYKSHAKQHPKYKTGEWTLDQVLQHFLGTFDTPEDPDGKVTREEFVNYYAGVCSTIDDDCYFDMMMRNCWGLPQRRLSVKS